MTGSPHDAGVIEGVGRTALLVAAGRAIETHRADSLAQDVYAEHFVRAARASADWPVRIEDAPGGDACPLWGRLARYFGLRTRVLDDFLLSATGRGTSQVVLLGAGLDARPFRLGWPDGTTIFEIDQEQVLSFKHSVLDRLGARPTASLHSIAADLREDWAGALVAAGYDATEPSVWLAEGLLLYLPAAAERRLVDTVDLLTAAGGGSLAYEIKIGAESPAVRANPLYSTALEQIGVDLLALFDTEPRPSSAAELTGRGWSTTVRTPFDFTAQYGRGPLPEQHDAVGTNRWVFADRARDAAASASAETTQSARLDPEPPTNPTDHLVLDGAE
ncbi:MULTISPECIES: SAM-dependent methyltransferase [Actinoalloteichus]|uniref:S-adenosyl-L-methionine-dependent methyltransferase n=1 Tax=Actinoalloteichus fjordicus TaxID=1612552 RepID=A0AAC9LCR0_9PSEU|nr:MULTISPECIES: SAM-dependent methyltransferase [Actinoalloteichus]APU15558.1 methyltransferase, TIGR00027 family [Actinoalloteichus fjordicus]APU21625.1 methyltransferase, TIGR00027 family [Actinoalloteichus sp. GBA129-24]